MLEDFFDKIAQGKISSSYLIPLIRDDEKRSVILNDAEKGDIGRIAEEEHIPSPNFRGHALYAIVQHFVAIGKINIAREAARVNPDPKWQPKAWRCIVEVTDEAEDEQALTVATSAT